MSTPRERQDVHHHVLQHFIETGRAPHNTELARMLGRDPATGRRLLHETTLDSPFLFAWMTPDTDYVGAWAPFSNLPNQNAISVDGVQKWFGQ